MLLLFGVWRRERRELVLLAVDQPTSCTNESHRWMKYFFEPECHVLLVLVY